MCEILIPKVFSGNQFWTFFLSIFSFAKKLLNLKNACFYAWFFKLFYYIFILLFKKGRKPLPAFIAGILVVVGSWFKRFLIVTPTLLHPFLPMHDVPANYHHYIPTWEEWAIAGGSLAGALLVITFFARIFPIIPIHETLLETEIHENEKHF